jgi:uncharacterized protein YegL
MKIKLCLFILLWNFLNIQVSAQEVPAPKVPQTTVSKGLEELDRVATKTWEEVKRIFKREKPLMAYKIGTNKHETVIKQHLAPLTYIPTRTLVMTTRDKFKSVLVEKEQQPQIEAKALFPRITATKGYVSFKVGDPRYQRYLDDITKDNIESLSLQRSDSVECLVKKWVLLPKREVKRHYSFVLDHSGSMGDDRANELQQSVFQAIQANVQRDPKALTTYSLQKFDGEGNIRHLGTSSEINSIKQLLVPPIGLAGFGRSTAIKDALYEAIQKLSQDKTSASKIIILFTDGESNTDQIPLELSEVIRMAIDNNINVIPIGFGEFVNEEYLKTIAYFAGGEFYHIYHEDEFVPLFDNMLLDIGLNYELEFSPCMFGDEVEIEIAFKGLESPLKANTFFSTPAKEGYTIDLNILFREASAELEQAADLDELEQLRLLMQYKPEIKVLIEGHTDKVGGEKYNLDLSLRRANAVKSYLVDRGIDAKRMETKGFGWAQPAYPYAGDDKENPLNRRIEVKIIQ